MRDQQHRHAALALQARQQAQHLRLDGHIQRGGGLIGHQHIRCSGQRHGDHHPLLQSAGELKRIFPQTPFGIRHAHLLQHRQRLLPRRQRSQGRVPLDHLDQLCTQGQNRIETGRRLLKNHRHAPPAHLAHGRLRQGQQVLALQ